MTLTKQLYYNSNIPTSPGYHSVHICFEGFRDEVTLVSVGIEEERVMACLRLG
jgi:hypothetical protein